MEAGHDRKTLPATLSLSFVFLFLAGARLSGNGNETM